MNAKNSDSFRWIVDRVYDKQMMTKKQVEALKDFGNLRNAIAHGRYFDDELLAFPHPKAVEQIEKLQALLTSPLQALSILPPHDVATLDIDADVQEALALIAFTRLFPDTCVQRPRVSSVPINVVLEHSEATDRAAFLPQTASAQQALETPQNWPTTAHIPARRFLPKTAPRTRSPWAFSLRQT